MYVSFSLAYTSGKQCGFDHATKRGTNMCHLPGVVFAVGSHGLFEMLHIVRETVCSLGRWGGACCGGYFLRKATELPENTEPYMHLLGMEREFDNM